jgi:hypothetical protein
MPCVYQSMLPFVYQPMLTHSVCASCECVCDFGRHGWYKAQPQNMPKDSKEYQVRGAHYIACILPFVYQPMLTHIVSVLLANVCVVVAGVVQVAACLPPAVQAHGEQKEYQVRGATLLHACMPFVSQSMLPLVCQPMLTHSVYASCDVVWSCGRHGTRLRLARSTIFFWCL